MQCLTWKLQSVIILPDYYPLSLPVGSLIIPTYPTQINADRCSKIAEGSDKQQFSEEPEDVKDNLKPNYMCLNLV